VRIRRVDAKKRTHWLGDRHHEVAQVKKAANVPRLRIVLAPTSGGPAQARREIEAFLRARRSDATIEIAQLVASELVTNALMYGGAPIELTVRDESDRLCVEVSDAGAVLIDLGDVRTVGNDEPGGRGLRVVDALACHWGSRAHQGGKTVWAELV
jgi:two-component sensor histidine kinase